jgi:penicillin-binding protein 2
MKIRLWMILLLIFLTVGCIPLLSTASSPTAVIGVTPSLAPGGIPDAKAVVQTYLDAWKKDDYSTMYALLTSVSQDALNQDEFTHVYQRAATEAALSGVDYEILSLLTGSDTSQVSYRVTLHSMLVGDVTRDTTMGMRLEKGQWRVQWDDALILPEMQGGNYLVMDRTGYTPSRANIYDRKGLALVAQTDATAIGLYPDQVDPTQADTLFARLADLTGVGVDTIQALYNNVPRGAGWYLPIGEVSADRAASKFDLLSGLSGVVMRPYKSRYYFEGGIAPHVIGYVSAIQPEEVEEYKRKGYQPDELVGRTGLEKWGESYLAGKRGGALYVFNPQGKPVTRLAEASAQPSQAIYTTLDKDFQLAAQQAIQNYKGAIVVLERNTGRVLAMVSSPSFDPNAFEPINYNSSSLLAEISNDPAQPLFNRATQGQYPLGSVFKIITMSAALDSGVYTPETTYQCGYTFDELQGMVLNDWTYDYYLQDHRTIPSGLLTLPQGLIRSCNPFFWHIGLDLYGRGLTTAVSNMARGFGLGSPTGIVGVDEASGNMPDPTNVVDAVNMAIGQGAILVTPLQVANFIAAVGNGGTLYRPQIVESIAPPDGKATVTFEPQVLGKLPLKPEDLQVLQSALVGVVRSEKPRGTAWHRFTGLDIPVTRKTGTAQSGSESPHAWFVGYTFANRKDKPDIAITVVVENIGEGSDYAAPIFRRIVELYFIGQPQKLYWWESTFNVTLTPTLPVTGTPLPAAKTTPMP